MRSSRLIIFLLILAILFVIVPNVFATTVTDNFYNLNNWTETGTGYTVNAVSNVMVESGHNWNISNINLASGTGIYDYRFNLQLMGIKLNLRHQYYYFGNDTVYIDGYNHIFTLNGGGTLS